MCCLEPFLKMSPVFLLLLGLAQACIPREVAIEEKSLMSRLSPDAADPPSHPHRAPSHDGSLCAPEPPVDGSAPHQGQHVVIHTQSAYYGAKAQSNAAIARHPRRNPGLRHINPSKMLPLAPPQGLLSLQVLNGTRRGGREGWGGRSTVVAPRSERGSSRARRVPPGRDLRVPQRPMCGSRPVVRGRGLMRPGAGVSLGRVWMGGCGDGVELPRATLCGTARAPPVPSVKPVLVTSLPKKLHVKRPNWNFFRCAYMMMTFLFVSYNRGDWCYCHYCNPDVDNRNDPCCAF
ncbi:epididymal protein 13 [Marmota marmota marmota]|uniref:epididymal protein 13 n=1 Tax=Marmota marmota marmota TaxID=9994 RepID=UPI002092BD77|nr:epididymal protein 13 [Marmota marmota marmota]